jgi:hypothetical protein
MTPLRALRRPALVALVFGTVVALVTTGRADPRLVASTTLYWSFVPILQLVAAVALVRSSRQRPPMAEAIDALFAANGPWALWLVALAGWAVSAPPVARPMFWILAAALVPLAWTPFLVLAFCRKVLGDPLRAALLKTALHQAAMLLSFLVYVANAIAFAPRLAGWWER